MSYWKQFQIQFYQLKVILIFYYLDIISDMNKEKHY